MAGERGRFARIRDLGHGASRGARAAAGALWLAFLGTTLVLAADGGMDTQAMAAGTQAAAKAPPVPFVQSAPADQAMTGAVSDAAQPAAPVGPVIAWLPDTVSRWGPLIAAAAASHGVDPNLVAIVVLVESGGSPTAASPSGALGLMQIMPATAEDIASRRGLAGHTTERLLEPAYNIDLGAWYIAEMLRIFGQADDPDWRTSVELAAAAYNGGPGTVRAFLESGGTLPAESARYRTWVGAMWSERQSAQSPGFASWMAAGGDQLVEAARAQT